MRLTKCLSILFIAFLFASCVNQKDYVYWQDAIPKSNNQNNKADTAKKAVKGADSTVYFTLRIQPFDVLDIKVSSSLDALGKILDPNRSVSLGAIGGNSSYYSSFLVDAQGNVNLPLTGEISLKGLTIKEAKEKVKDQMKIYMKDPFVDIKFLTFRVTVLGAVGRPGQIVLSNEKANIVDALSQAGDITDFGKPKKVKLIRGDLSNPTVYEIDMTSIKSFTNDGFNLMPNDIIYVAPTKRKFFLANIGTIIGISSLLNIITLVYTIVRLR